jgi:hypothetical protein
MDETIRDLCSLCNILSKYITTENIPLTDQKEFLLQSFYSYINENSVRNLGDLLSLLCALQKHQKAEIQLDCSHKHCVYCYIDIVAHVPNPNMFFCTHGMLLPPAAKAKLEREQKRLEALMCTCIICHETKDKMNFAILNSHGCKVCTDCIKGNFQIRSKDNSCPGCQNKLVGDSDILIRELIEMAMLPEEIEELYKKPCPTCGKEKNSKEFIQVCMEGCKVCSECLAKLNGKNTCDKGHQISRVG